MLVVLSQIVYCNGIEDFDHYTSIQKTYDCSIIPRIGESVYNYVWDEDVETKVADVHYDYDNNKCYILLEKRNSILDKETFVGVARSHGWEIKF